MPSAEIEKDIPDRDAVCFTSGPSGAPFSAGVIHAWLAAGRKPPLVAAGISMGAISAAAMQRVFHEINAAPDHLKEQKRWEWYRRYLAAVTQDPLSALWKALPDPVDFFGKLPPVKDQSVPPLLESESESGRRHYYLLTRLGVWLAHLPVRVSTIATFTVMYVRRQENYGNPIVRNALFWWNLFKILAGLFWHLLRKPSFIFERSFSTEHKRDWPHPLFGWPAWLLVIGIFLATTGSCIWGAISLVRGITQHRITVPQLLLWTAIAVVLISLLIPLAKGIAYLRKRFGWAEGTDSKWVDTLEKWARNYIFSPLDISKALLNPFEAKRQLHDLFADAPTAGFGENDVSRLIVCAALESVEQVIFKEDSDTVTALTAAIAIPGLFPPYAASRDELFKVPKLEGEETPSKYQLVDGSAVRTNPLPAFFDWCKENDHTRQIASALQDASKKRPALHVVYNVPITVQEDTSKPLPYPDIVESARQALKLEKRRDTRQEVRQTNYMARLESVRQNAGGNQDSKRPIFMIRADEIAPAAELDPGNSFSPDRNKLLQIVAQGCKATLETLYQDELQRLGPNVDCKMFLKSISQPAGVRLPGLPEVCSSCVGRLDANIAAKLAAKPEGWRQSYGKPDDKPVHLDQEFSHLIGPKPNIVFLGSGGVFRGAFHIGVIAAMVEAELYPKLVIGASVGALMGGALCNMTAGPKDKESAVLAELASVFLHVDSRVALTRTLKNAVKQLGTRSRSIRLSPSELTRMVDRGSKADAGFAATGAPPALIDAISSLFMVPRRKTAYISSKFVAGHISEAFAGFLKELRTETLDSFEIQEAVIGVSMLANRAKALLGYGVAEVDPDATQPYHHGRPGNPVSFFCTTSYLNAQVSMLLGRDFLTANPTWSALYASLSSSAFPAAFAPRRESDVLPGTGDPGRFFADGGLFDNLPFFPAIEILSAVQHAAAGNPPAETTPRTRRLARSNAPNIFIAAGLNASPDFTTKCESLFQIKDRAAGLSVNNKTQSFLRAAKKTTEALKEINASHSNRLNAADVTFLEGSVAATVISIVPADTDHINPTFAFCQATGLKKQRVERSIADGCFQSLMAFTQNSEVLAPIGAPKIVPRQLGEDRKKWKPQNDNNCPYFQKGGEDFLCPFARAKETVFDVGEVYTRCIQDKVHQDRLRNATADPHGTAQPTPVSAPPATASHPA